MTAVLAHDPGCANKTREHSDAAKRMSDTHNLHLTVRGHDAVGRFFAAALHDGSGDGVLYESKADAVRHQKHNEQFYVYVPVTPASTSPCEMQSWLTYVRALYDAGARLPDRDAPSGGPQPIPRLTVEDHRAAVRSVLFGTRPKNLIWQERP